MFQLLEGIGERHEIVTIIQQLLSFWRKNVEESTRELVGDFLMEKKRERKRRARELQHLENCKQQKISSEEELR